MHFDLIQSISLAGSTATPNDDRCGATSQTAWMIDGATDLGPPGLMGNQPGAAWLAATASRAFAAAEADALPDILDHVFARTAAAYAAGRTRDPVDDWELPSAAFLAVALTDRTLDLAWLADCACLVLRDDAAMRLGPQPSADETEQARVHAAGAERPLAMLRGQRMRPGRYILGVDPAHRAFVEHLRVPVAPGDEILLMTDGMAALVDDYGMPVDAFIAMLRAEGLPSLATRLRTIETEDHDRIRYPRFKRSDDATALWLRIAD
ncbi:protein phosphatase 2C domain-containing protein [Sphingomonas koreensis]